MNSQGRIELDVAHKNQQELIAAQQAGRMVVIPIEDLDQKDPLVAYAKVRKADQQFLLDMRRAEYEDIKLAIEVFESIVRL